MTVLVSVMHANNELGTLQPIAGDCRIAREAACSACGWSAGAGQSPRGRECAGRGPVQHERAQALRTEGRGRSLRAQGNEAGADYFRRPPRARSPAGNGERAGNRGLRLRAPNWRDAHLAAEAARIASAARSAWRIRGAAIASSETGINGSRWKRGRQHHQHLLRRHRRRSAGDRARSAWLRGFDRLGLFERRRQSRRTC